MNTMLSLVLIKVLFLENFILIRIQQFILEVLFSLPENMKRSEKIRK